VRGLSALAAVQAYRLGWREGEEGAHAQLVQERQHRLCRSDSHMQRVLRHVQMDLAHTHAPVKPELGTKTGVARAFTKAHAPAKAACTALWARILQ